MLFAIVSRFFVKSGETESEEVHVLLRPKEKLSCGVVFFLLLSTTSGLMCSGCQASGKREGYWILLSSLFSLHSLFDCCKVTAFSARFQILGCDKVPFSAKRRNKFQCFCNDSKISWYISLGRSYNSSFLSGTAHLLEFRVANPSILSGTARAPYLL